MAESALPRFLADEMVGRLARYLRFLGCDTEYVRDQADESIAQQAEREHRVLLTRDRQLATRTDSAFLLTSPAIEEQVRAVLIRFPQIPHDVSFARCGRCNGRLAPADALESGRGGPAPAAARQYVCERCGQRFWEGSHTRQVQERVHRWLARVPE
jgi:uncharacterized protein